MWKPGERGAGAAENQSSGPCRRLQVAGITMERDSVSRIEIGTRFVTDYELVVLAKVLGVSMEWLAEQEEN